MKKTISVLTLISLLVGLLACLVGCGNQASPVNVVIVDGNARANCGKYSFDIPSVSAILNRAAHYGFVGQVSVEGLPRETASFSVQDLSKQGLTSQKVDELAQTNQATIVQTLQALTVVSGEADVLKAVQLGARSLQAVKVKDAESYLIVIDSLLQTGGILDFTASNLLEADPAILVEALRSRGEIPDFSDQSIVVFGCGDTIAPQEPLNAQARANLKAIWEAIFRAGNAKSVEFREELPSDTEVNELLPKVSTVSIISDKLIFDEATIPANEPSLEETPTDRITRLDDTSVGFVADTAEFRDPAAAKTVISPFSEYLLAHPDQTILIAGSTATAGTKEGCLALSQDRASAVGELLLADGVRSDQLICIGLGQEQHSLRVPDTTADGQLIEEAAKRNRAVYIIILPSDTAAELLQIAG